MQVLSFDQDSPRPLGPGILRADAPVFVIEPFLEGQFNALQPHTLTNAAHAVSQSWVGHGKTTAKFHFYVRSVAGTGGTARIDIFEYDWATGMHTGSSLANGSVALASSAGRKEIEIAFAHDDGQLYCAVFTQTDGSPGTNNFVLGVHPNTTFPGWRSRRSIDWATNKTFQKSLSQPVIMTIENSDGSIYGFPTAAWNANTSCVWKIHDEQGLGYIMNFDEPTVIWEALWIVSPISTIASAGSIQTVVRNSQGTFIDASSPVLNSVAGLTAGAGVLRPFPFGSPISGGGVLIPANHPCPLLLEQTLNTGGDSTNHWLAYGVAAGSPVPPAGSFMQAVQGSAWGGPYVALGDPSPTLLPYLQLSVTPARLLGL